MSDESTIEMLSFDEKPDVVKTSDGRVMNAMKHDDVYLLPLGWQKEVDALGLKYDVIVWVEPDVNIAGK